MYKLSLSLFKTKIASSSDEDETSTDLRVRLGYVNMPLFVQLFCVVALLPAILLLRVEILPFTLFFPIFAVLILLCLLAGLWQMVALFHGLLVSKPLVVSQLIGALLCLLLIAYLLAIVVQLKSVPVIHDISTDSHTPPRFYRALQLRTAAHNPLNYTQEVAALQQQAYADIQPLIIAMNVDGTYQLVRRSLETLGLQIHYEDKQQGHLEATATSRLFGFTDDIVVRLNYEETGTRIDIRSASRVGRSDLGANAQRIRAIMRLIFEAEEANTVLGQGR